MNDTLIQLNLSPASVKEIISALSLKLSLAQEFKVRDDGTRASRLISSLQNKLEDFELEKE